ncbi:unnamed protein product [Urochloa humidicola]
MADARHPPGAGAVRGLARRIQAPARGQREAGSGSGNGGPLPWRGVVSSFSPSDPAPASSSPPPACVCVGPVGRELRRAGRVGRLVPSAFPTVPPSAALCSTHAHRRTIHISAVEGGKGTSATDPLGKLGYRCQEESLHLERDDKAQSAKEPTARGLTL